MTGRPLLGLVLAIVVEARHWTRIRWEFDDETSGRVWQFNSIGIVLAAGLIWLDGNRYTALPNTLAWLPALLMPMQFIQSYGLRDAMPLSIFSFLAKHRRERSRRLGLIEEAACIHFGNFLFVITLVAASVGAKSNAWTFLPGLLILSGWMLMSTKRCRPQLMLPVLALVGLLGLSGRIALERAEDWLGQSAGSNRGGFDPNYTSTLIGTAGTVQQSNDIIWRLNPHAGSAPPRLLRNATYNFFLGSSWRNQRVATADFKDLDTRLIGGVPYFLLQESTTSLAPTELAGFTLRGSAEAETPLPLPGDCALLRDFELDGIEINTYGTVRVFPKHPVIDGTALRQSGANPESPPLPQEDLQIPIVERQAVRATLQNLGITGETPLHKQLAAIQRFFGVEFRYTRSPTIRQPSSRTNGPTAISRFLTETRAGHCEYFASAAVLLLREAGIPARYATGYAVAERDMKHGGFVIRGIHGHAWCRVWDAASGTWIDFDPTPPNWLANLASQQPLTQRLNDQLKRLREDFFIWRNRPANRLNVSLAMLGIGIILAGFVARRLWRSRRRLESAMRATAFAGSIVRTPLHELETSTRKILGARPPGQTFAHWFARLRGILDDGDLLDEALALHQRLRFDPAPPRQEDLQRLALLTARLEATIKAHIRLPSRQRSHFP
jgi:transglutaminase-like putative cysteine protease